MTIISGAQAYTQYGWETVAFGTVATTIDKAFGHEVNISVDRKRSFTKLFGVGARNATHFSPGKFDGSATVEFALANGYWLRAVLGSAPSDGGGGPFTHTYSESDTLTSMSIENGLDLSTDSIITLLGVVVNMATISGTVGETVKVRLECVYKTESEGTSLDGSPATESEDPFYYAQATFEMPDGTTISNIQSFEIPITNNAELIHGIGSEFAVASVAKNREYEVRLTVPYEAAATLLETFYGSGTGPSADPAELATGQLTITNGGAGTALRSLVVNLTNLKIDTDTMAARAGEIINEDVTIFARVCSSIVYTNNTAVAP